LRIIGGRFRGTALAGVGKGDAAAHLRPTTDRVRESLFNLITHGDYPPRALIRDNADRLGVTGQIKIWRRDAARLGENKGQPYSLIFLDPPYGKSLGEKALTSAQTGGWIAPGALIIWEEGGEVMVPANLILMDTRTYGDTTLRLLLAGDEA